MHRTQRLVLPLRVLLVLAFLALLVGQLRAAPAIYDDWVRGAPERDGAWLLTVAELELLCVQVVVVCTWQLLTRVQQDRIFSAESILWVDVVLGAMAVAWLLLLGTLLHVGLTGAAGPSEPLLVLLLAGGAALGLLVLVMRALLRQATELRTDLETVI